MVVYPPIAKRFCHFDDELEKTGGNVILTVFYYLIFLDIEFYNSV